MGQIFREAGYHTIWAGKWHIPESYTLRAKSRQREIPGFELLPFYDTTLKYPEWGKGLNTDPALADAVAN